MRRATTYLTLAAAVILMTAPQARAGGFSIYEQGARAMGRASAFVAAPDDPSAIFYNPAGLAMLDGTQLYIGGTAPYPGYGVEERQTYQIFPPPNLYVSHRLNEKLVLGFGVTSPFGLGTAWHHPNTFTGRYVSTKTDLQAISLSPTVGYQASDRFAIGLGLEYRISTLLLERYVGALNPNDNQVHDVAKTKLESDWNSGLGINLGLLFKASEKVSLGLAYRGGIKIDYTGTATLDQVVTGDTFFDAQVAQMLGNGTADLTTSIDFPGSITGGVAYMVNPDLLVEADLNFTMWSSFDKLESEGLADDPDSQLEDINVPENYEDTITLRLGLEHMYTDVLTLRAGYLWDQGPAPPASVSPLLPDANRNGFTLGAGYDFGSMTVDVAAMYLKFDEASTEMEAHSGFDGVYDSSAWLLGFNVSYPIR